MATALGPGVDALHQAQAFQGALHRLLPLLQFRERSMAGEHGLSVTQCLALSLLADEEGLAVNELAARLCLDKSTMSRVARGLEARGYIARTRSSEDRRVVRLTATAAGHGARLRINDELVALYAELLADFDPEVRTVMTRMVSRLADSCAARVDAGRGSCRVVR